VRCSPPPESERRPDDYHPLEMNGSNRLQWTADEQAREDRVREIRTRQDRHKRPEERLEETVRLSRLISELREPASRDVPSR
jgi:hypothetical protein